MIILTKYISNYNSLMKLPLIKLLLNKKFQLQIKQNLHALIVLSMSTPVYVYVELDARRVAALFKRPIKGHNEMSRILIVLSGQRSRADGQKSIH